jgi:hypothetical protein
MSVLERARQLHVCRITPPDQHLPGCSSEASMPRLQNTPLVTREKLLVHARRRAAVDAKKSRLSRA